MNDLAAPRKPVTLHRLREMQAAGEPIAMLTCYDASFARVLDHAGVDCLLIGDSLGMVIQGETSTLPVTLAPPDSAATPSMRTSNSCARAETSKA